MRPAAVRQVLRRLIVVFAALEAARYAVRALHARTPAVAPHAAPEADARQQVCDLCTPAGDSPPRRRSRTRRAALALAFTTVFFAGAALTAGAGDEAGKLLDEAADVATTTQPGDTTEAQPPSEQVPAPVPPPAPESSPSEGATVPQAPPLETEGDPVGSDEPQPVRSSAAPAAPDVTASTSSAPTKRVAPERVTRRPRPLASAEDEAAVHGGGAVIWLSRALPDPTPPARRLDRWFVYDLLRSSRRANVDWALVLGVLRARGHGGRTPADAGQLEALAERLRAAGAARDEPAAALAVTGSADLAVKASALARYNRAVGTETLVRGLAASKDALVERVLKDRRVDIYAGGRGDLVFGRVDVRVVALISYLAESYGQVTVTSLFSGHGLYARPGVVSAHAYGHAVDVAGLAGLSITGNQAPGGLAEQAVRSILRLPAELQPGQVISLLGLGGASFPLADHHDHIHVGY